MNYLCKVSTFLIVSILSCLNPILAEDTILRILHTNDMHSYLLPHKICSRSKCLKEGGMAGRFTIINAARKEDSDLLLLDSGDLMDGSELFYKNYGIPDIYFMNQLRYDALAIGNREFNKGTKVLSQRILEAKFPFLSSNLEFSNNSILKDLVKPYLIKTIKGLNVGIIGVTTTEIEMLEILHDEVKPKSYAPVVQKYIDMIDPETDLIIILSHIGYENDKVLATQIKNADLIIGGHSHTRVHTPLVVNDREGNPLLIFQAGSFGRYIGDMKLAVENDKAKLVSYKMHTINSSVKKDKEIAKQLKPFQKSKKSLECLGVTQVSLDNKKIHKRTRETNLGDLFAEAIKATLGDVEVVFISAEGISGDQIIEPGILTDKTVKALQKKKQAVVQLILTGKQIKEVLERGVSNLPDTALIFMQVAGISFVVDTTKQPQVLSKKKIQLQGQRVSTIKLNGVPLINSKKYKVAVNESLAKSMSKYLTFEKLKFPQKVMRELIQIYIQKHSPINIQTDGRITIKG